MQDLTVSVFGVDGNPVLSVKAQDMFNWLLVYTDKVAERAVSKALNAPVIDPEKSISCVQIAKDFGMHPETIKKKRKIALNAMKIDLAKIGKQAAIKQKDIQTVLKQKIA